MDIEALVDQILDRCLHSEPVHSDPYTNERAIRAEIWNMIQDFVDQQEIYQ